MCPLWNIHAFSKVVYKEKWHGLICTIFHPIINRAICTSAQTQSRCTGLLYKPLHIFQRMDSNCFLNIAPSYYVQQRLTGTCACRAGVGDDRNPLLSPIWLPWLEQKSWLFNSWISTWNSPCWWAQYRIEGMARHWETVGADPSLGERKFWKANRILHTPGSVTCFFSKYGDKVQLKCMNTETF